jgi:hypothetical protein
MTKEFSHRTVEVEASNSTTRGGNVAVEMLTGEGVDPNRWRTGAPDSTVEAGRYTRIGRVSVLTYPPSPSPPAHNVRHRTPRYATWHAANDFLRQILLGD